MGSMMPEGNTKGEKIILAYSGGLDTTAIIPWLKEHFGYKVICVCVDVGQEEELSDLPERAKLSGAEKLYIETYRTNFVRTLFFPVFRPMLAMKINISLVPLWLVPPLPKDWWKLPGRKGLPPFAMEPPEREMTKFVLN